MSEKTKLDLVHIFYPLTSWVFIRSILSPRETKKNWNYHLVLPIETGVEQQEFLRKYFNDELIIHLASSEDEAFGLTDQINPMAIITSVYATQDYIGRLRKKIRCRKIFFVPHGLARPNKNHNYRQMDSEVFYFLPDNSWRYHLLRDVPEVKAKNRYLSLPGLPQFDLLLNHRQEFMSKDRHRSRGFDRLEGKINFPPASEQMIFLVACGVNYPYTHTLQPVKFVFETIRKIFPNSFIYFKAKGPHHPISRAFQTDIKNGIYMIGPHEILYEYFFADVHIIMEGGTTWLESLMVNPTRTILYQNENPSLDYDYSKYGGEGLMISRTVEDFENYLINIQKGSQLSSHYQSKINDLTINYLGKKVNIISDQILKYISNYLDK